MGVKLFGVRVQTSSWVTFLEMYHPRFREEVPPPQSGVGVGQKLTQGYKVNPVHILRIFSPTCTFDDSKLLGSS